MELVDNMFGPHLANLQNALGRTSRRHALLTENLANLNTPGYKRKDMDFSILLEEQLAGPSGIQSRLAEAENANRGSIRIDGNSVDLEQEVMAMAETELRYQALTDLTSRHFAGLQSVIRGGR